jgi:hypothetical protein
MDKNDPFKNENKLFRHKSLHKNIGISVIISVLKNLVEVAMMVIHLR